MAFCCDFFTAKFEWRPKKQNNIFTPVCAIFIRLIEMKTNAKRLYLTIFLFVILLGDICFIVRFMFFCAIFDHQIRMKTEQIRKKRYFSLSLYGGTLNFPLGEAKSQWEDANYRWEDVSLILLKYWLYFHLQVKPLHHYCNTDTVRNQHQLLTCQTSKWQSLLF